ARAAMETMGYRPLPTVSSPEEEAIRLKIAHIRPYVKPGRLPVELHATLPGMAVEPGGLFGSAECGVRNAECGIGDWSAQRAPEIGDSSGGPDSQLSTLQSQLHLLRLAPEQFVVHTAAHFVADFEMGNARLNGLCDLLRL